MNLEQIFELLKLLDKVIETEIYESYKIASVQAYICADLSGKYVFEYGGGNVADAMFNCGFPCQFRTNKSFDKEERIIFDKVLDKFNLVISSYYMERI